MRQPPARPLVPHRPWAAAAVAALALTACAVSPDDATDRSRPRNVLFIAVDDLRPELGCYGVAHAVTPHIDRLAAGGVVFTAAHCQSAVCNPSRASLMTGLRPETIGVLDLGTDLRKVSPDVVTLPQHLRASGWTTVSVGKIYHNIFPDEPSWDERHYVDGFPFDPDAVYVGDEGQAIQQQRIEAWRERGVLERRRDRFGHVYVKAQATEAPDVDDSAYYDGAQTDWAVDRIASLAESDEPFFLAVGYYRPHLPFNAPRRYWDLYDPDALPLSGDSDIPRGAPSVAINNLRELGGYSDFRHLKHPTVGVTSPEHRVSEADARRLAHGYLASVSYVDAQVGRLLDRLDELGLADDTIVVLWGDHGWKLGDHASWGKMTNYEIDTRVPLIVRSPAHAPGRANGLVEFVDVFPTVCDLLDVEAPTDRAGQSLVPLLDDPTRPGKDVVSSQYLREGTWVGPTGVEAMGRSVRTADGMRYVEWRPRGGGEPIAEELYVYEPGGPAHESVNLADSPAHAGSLETMREHLRRAFPPQDR